MVLVTTLASWRLDQVGRRERVLLCQTFWDLLGTLSKDWVIKYRVESVQFYCWWFYILFHGQGMVYYKNFRVRKEFIKRPQITYTYRENIIAYSSFSALLVHRWQNHHLCFSWLWKNMKSEFEIMGTENPSSWFKITVFCFTISFYKWNNSHKCYINTLHFVNQEIVCKYLQPGSLPVISFSLYSSPFNPLKPSFT